MKTVKGERQAIHTSTWFTPLPKGYQRVGISLYKPRGFKGEHWEVKQLAPGRWYGTVPPKQYLELYNPILAALEPQTIVNALYHIGPNPVLCCFESVESIASGLKFCHRHLVAKWLKDTLDLTVQEFGAPDLAPFKAFERIHVKVPDYRPVNILAGG